MIVTTASNTYQIEMNSSLISSILPSQDEVIHEIRLQIEEIYQLLEF